MLLLLTVMLLFGPRGWGLEDRYSKLLYSQAARLSWVLAVLTMSFIPPGLAITDVIMRGFVNTYLSCDITFAIWGKGGGEGFPNPTKTTKRHK